MGVVNMITGLVLVCLMLTLGAAKPIGVHLALGDVPGTMNVMWQLIQCDGDDTVGTVTYGREGYATSVEVSAVTSELEHGTGCMFSADLVDLEPHTRYIYSVGDKTSRSKDFQFTTPSTKPDKHSTVTFLAYGDMGIHEPTTERTLNAVAKNEPLDSVDYISHLGDVAYAFGNFTRWKVWMERITKIAAYVPYVVTVGNRDDSEVIAERFKCGMLSTSPLKAERDVYYSFKYSWLYVISLDSSLNISPSSDQFKWLKQSLKDAARLRAQPESDVKWIIVQVHTPLYSSSDGHDGGNADLRKEVQDLFVKHNVTMVISGDDHVYERQHPRNGNEIVPMSGDKLVDPPYPIFYTIGTGGIGLDGWTDDDAPAYSAYRAIHHGYLKVIASRTDITTKFIKASDSQHLDLVTIVSTKPFGSGSDFVPRERASPVSLLWAIPIGIAVYIGYKKFTTKTKRRYVAVGSKE